MPTKRTKTERVSEPAAPITEAAPVKKTRTKAAHGTAHRAETAAAPKRSRAKKVETATANEAAEVATAPALPAEVVPAVPSPEAITEEISRLAYQLWLEEGQRPGTNLDDWYRAEALVKQRYGISK